MRNFAKGFGLLARTDALDAEILRTYEELAPLRIYKRPRHNIEVLSALVKEQMHLVRLSGQEARRFKCVDPAVRHTTESVLRELKSSIKRVERELKNTFQKINPSLKTQNSKVKSKEYRPLQQPHYKNCSLNLVSSYMDLPRWQEIFPSKQESDAVIYPACL